MMNELFVLGELMESPQNGYHLRNAMQASLGKNRKVSFGVLYPLLDKLAKNGLITITVNEEGRTQKTASITDKGRQRFFELMKQDVPSGAHTEEIYLIKLDSMQHPPLDEQKELLMVYIREKQITVDEIKGYLKKLDEVKKIDHWYATKKLELLLGKAQLAIQWAEDFLSELPYVEE